MYGVFKGKWFVIHKLNYLRNSEYFSHMSLFLEDLCSLYCIPKIDLPDTSP